MGANEFFTRSRGKDIGDAYQNAVDEAAYEYGHQEGYSGQINCTTGYIDMTKVYKSSKKDLNKFIEDNWKNLSKFSPCWAICVKKPVENTNKIKSQVEHTVESGTKKWLLKYVVKQYNDKLKYFDDKGSAVKYAREYTEKTEKPTEVHMERVLQGGKTCTAKIKYKPGPKESPGEWVFFGLAPC